MELKMFENTWWGTMTRDQRWPVVRVPAQDIDCSGPWLLWPHKNDAVCRSLAHVGQLSPVLVDASGPRPLLVDGAARVAWLSEQGQDVYGLNIGSCSAQDKAMLYIYANIHRLSLDADKVRALRFFVQHDAPHIDAVMQVLGLVPHSRPAKQALAWLALPAHWDTYLAGGALPLVCADILRLWDAHDLQAVEAIFQTLSWSRGLIVQVLTWIHEVHVRDGCDVAQVLARADVMDSVQANLSPKDAMARIAARVRALRYPELTRLEQRATDTARVLAAGTRWRMVQPDQFESDSVELAARVRSPAEVQQAVAELVRMAEHAEWAAFWPGKEA